MENSRKTRERRIAKIMINTTILIINYIHFMRMTKAKQKFLLLAF